jgi:NAD(P)-dependent dehydrogenase (short-subunit alcohol dehydrogenase family)
MKNYIEQLFSLESKVAIVTGASRGIGEAVAQGLSLAGAKVYGLSRSTKKSEEVEGIHYLSCDLTQREDLETIINRIYQESTKIDILVNIAGITLPDKTLSLESKIKTFDQTLDVNVKAPFSIIHLVSEYMKHNEKGSIINFTSIAAESGFPGNPSYVSSKGALKMLTKAFAEDLSPYGIRVNSIAPGYIHTDMTTKSYHEQTAYERRKRNTMLNRWGVPEDLIGAAVFLASDSASYITGIDLLVDGGWTAKGMV